MPTKKVNKTEILADIARALIDGNTVVQVQTINAKEDGLAYFYDGKEHTPSRRGKTLHGPVSANRIHANGIKINNDIQIQVKKNTVKSRDGKYDVYIGNTFIIHTPHGELNIPTNDNDARVLWDAALGLYDDQNADNDGFVSAMTYMYKYLQDPELHDIADGPRVFKEHKSTIEKAKEKMKALGVTKTQNMDAYIANKAQEKLDEFLADIVRALRDENTTVLVQTVNGRHIPARDGKIRRGPMSKNRADASSIKINDDIKIRKKRDLFIVHTPHGEMNIQYGYQDDIFVLWTVALQIYDSQNNGDQDTFSRAERTMKNKLKSPELRKIVDSPIKPLDTRSKYEKVKEQMAKLRITKTKNLDAYIAQQQAKGQSK